MFDVFSSRGREHVEHDPTVTRKVRLRDIGALRSMKSGSDKFNDQDQPPKRSAGSAKCWHQPVRFAEQTHGAPASLTEKTTLPG
jgi:hypothetical protein